MICWLTDDELVTVTQGLYDLFAPYTGRDTAPRARPSGARAVRFFAYAFPGAPSSATAAKEGRA
jgi:hypothetical protein